MGFLQDFGINDIIDEFNGIKSELSDTGHDIKSSFLSSKQEIESTVVETSTALNETTTELQENIATILPNDDKDSSN